jgi:hypothetical protein
MAEWKIPGTDIVLKNVHEPSACAGQPCVIHNPSDHHMRDWQLHWRSDRKMFERICPCGVGHPDPDQIAYWERSLPERLAQAESVHGCCGCCSPKNNSEPEYKIENVNSISIDDESFPHIEIKFQDHEKEFLEQLRDKITNRLDEIEAEALEAKSNTNKITLVDAQGNSTSVTNTEFPSPFEFESSGGKDEKD